MSEGILCFTAALCIAIQTLLTQAADQRTSRHKYISSWVLGVARGIDSDILFTLANFLQGIKKSHFKCSCFDMDQLIGNLIYALCTGSANIAPNIDSHISPISPQIFSLMRIFIDFCIAVVTEFIYALQ